MQSNSDNTISCKMAPPATLMKNMQIYFRIIGQNNTKETIILQIETTTKIINIGINK